MAETPNLGLPLMVSAQAQKEVTHNEALVLIDALLAGVVEGAPRNDPPTVAQSGQCWIIGQSPQDSWANMAGQLAIWTDGGWRFVAPKRNMQMRSVEDGTIVRFDGLDWQSPPEILGPDGGTTVDTEARSVLAALLQLLQGHGMVKMT